jgi:tetratricopeptide (TPR) repeat protein
MLRARLLVRAALKAARMWKLQEVLDKPHQLALTDRRRAALPRGHFELGKLYLQQAAYDRAEKSLERAIQLDPKMLGAYYQYGLVCLRNGKPDRGKELLNLFHQKKELYAPVPAPEPLDP